MIEGLRKVIRRMHYPLEVMLTCVRWYAAYPLSLRHIEEMMQERGVFVDHATVHRWAIKILPVLAAVFRRRKRPVGQSWRMDETYIRVAGQWKYLYRAVDRDGATVDFLLTPSETSLRPADSSSGRSTCTTCQRRSPSTRVAPTRQPLTASWRTPAPTQRRQAKYLNNIVEQDHRAIKGARATDAGFQVISVRAYHARHRDHAHDPQGADGLPAGPPLSAAQQFYSLAC